MSISVEYVFKAPSPSSSSPNRAQQLGNSEKRLLDGENTQPWDDAVDVTLFDKVAASNTPAVLRTMARVAGDIGEVAAAVFVSVSSVALAASVRAAELGSMCVGATAMGKNTLRAIRVPTLVTSLVGSAARRSSVQRLIILGNEDKNNVREQRRKEVRVEEEVTADAERKSMLNADVAEDDACCGADEACWWLSSDVAVGYCS